MATNQVPQLGLVADNDNSQPVYLDCNATTPIDPEVLELMLEHFRMEYGNSGSRTHEFGARAKRAVERAREQVASVVNAGRDEVIFTSGATESNNLAILGLAEFGRKSGRMHIVSTGIEHKAVLEPLEQLEAVGFEITLVSPGSKGWVESKAISSAVRDDTLLVSVMHVNNETGIVQPIDEIAEAIGDHHAYLHVDAAQSFGKLDDALQNKRIHLISVSGHKVFGPKGVGALITRRRGYERPPLSPLMWGGGQERGLRPGTLPVSLIVGLGKAAELAGTQRESRKVTCLEFRARLLRTLLSLGAKTVGDLERSIYSAISVRFPGVDSEALMVALKNVAAISNGSACTSAARTPSHVLKAMALSDKEIQETIRLSWCHLTAEPDWAAFSQSIENLQ